MNEKKKGDEKWKQQKTREKCSQLYVDPNNHENIFRIRWQHAKILLKVFVELTREMGFMIMKFFSGYDLEKHCYIKITNHSTYFVHVYNFYVFQNLLLKNFK